MAIDTLTWLLERLAPDDPARSATLCQLASYQHEAGHVAQERTTLSQALSLVQGSGQAGSLEGMLRAAEIWDRLGQLAEEEQDERGAQEAWRQAAEFYREIRSHNDLPPAAPAKLTALRNLRETHLRLREFEEAGNVARVVDLLRQTRSLDDPEYVAQLPAWAVCW